MAGLRGSDRSGARTMCPGQIRGGRIKIKSPAGQKCMSHGQLFWPAGDYFSPRAKICVPRAIILARGRLFWPAGDYFGPRAKDDKAYSLTGNLKIVITLYSGPNFNPNPYSNPNHNNKFDLLPSLAMSRDRSMAVS